MLDVDGSHRYMSPALPHTAFNTLDLSVPTVLRLDSNRAQAPQVHSYIAFFIGVKVTKTRRKPITYLCSLTKDIIFSTEEEARNSKRKAMQVIKEFPFLH